MTLAPFIPCAAARATRNSLRLTTWSRPGRWLHRCQRRVQRLASGEHHRCHKPGHGPGRTVPRLGTCCAKRYTLKQGSTTASSRTGRPASLRTCVVIGSGNFVRIMVRGRIPFRGRFRRGTVSMPRAARAHCRCHMDGLASRRGLRWTLRRVGHIIRSDNGPEFIARAIRRHAE